jgi:hypothetical protein
MLALTFGSVAAVLLAVLARVARPDTPSPARIGAAAAAAMTVIGLSAWLPTGPLTDGWARRAGTPSSVLTAFNPPAKRRSTTAHASDAFAHAFSAAFAGPVREGTSANGTAVVDLQLRLHGQPDGVLRIRLGGSALPGGGLSMQRSAVTLGPPARPTEYEGKVQFLQDNFLRAEVGSADGRAVRLSVSLSVDGGSVNGTVSGRPLT